MALSKDLIYIYIYCIYIYINLYLTEPLEHGDMLKQNDLTSTLITERKASQHHRGPLMATAAFTSNLSVPCRVCFLNARDTHTVPSILVVLWLLWADCKIAQCIPPKSLFTRNLRSNSCERGPANLKWIRCFFLYHDLTIYQFFNSFQYYFVMV